MLPRVRAGDRDSHERSCYLQRLAVSAVVAIAAGDLCLQIAVAIVVVVEAVPWSSYPVNKVNRLELISRAYCRHT